MKNTKHLVKFVREAVIKRKRERYVGYLVNKKGQTKFLAALDHDLLRDIDDSKAVNELSEKEWLMHGYFYSSQGAYDIPNKTITEAYEKAPWEGGWLILSESGGLGVYRPEGRIDGEIYIKL